MKSWMRIYREAIYFVVPGYNSMWQDTHLLVNTQPKLQVRKNQYKNDASLFFLRNDLYEALE